MILGHVCLPLPLLPPQRRAAAGAQQDDYGKPVSLRQQRERGHLRRPLPLHRSHTCKARATGGASLGVLPFHDSKREVAVDEQPEAAGIMSNAMWFWIGDRDEKNTGGECLGDPPSQRLPTRSCNRYSRTCRAEIIMFIMQGVP